MRTENNYPYGTEDDIKIDDLNDPRVQMEWARQSGGAESGRGKRRRKKRAWKKKQGGIKAGDYEPGSGGGEAPDWAAVEGMQDGREQRGKAGREAVSRVTRKNRKRQKRNTVFSAFLCVSALAALTGCFILWMENRKLHNEVQVAMAYVDEVKAIRTYTEEEVQKMTADAAAQAAEQSSMEKEKEILDDIRARMESGDGAAPMLRAVFKNELVVADDGRYYFFPISETLKRHSYQAEQFQMNENDILEYFVDGNVASKKGIDVSKYQGNINWKKVAGDGVEYAFIRLGIRGASEGNLILDATFEDNISCRLKYKTDIYLQTPIHSLV